MSTTTTTTTTTASTTTLTFSGSDMDAISHVVHSSPAKSRKSFGITRKTSAVKLSGSSTHEKASLFSTPEHTTNTTTNNNNMHMPITLSSSTTKEKKSMAAGFLSYFFKPFRTQKTTPTKLKAPVTEPTTTVASVVSGQQPEATSSSSPRKDSKFEQELSVSKLNSLPSTPTAPRFSQALYIPGAEASIPAQILAYRNTSTDNPCLFIAFEQAIKSGVLTAPSIPPELIVKYQQDLEARSERRSRYMRKGSLSRSLDIHYAQKLFILTSSSLIQYGSEGSYDREPERLLKLRPDSLVFATDIFDGKHFVLQITSGGPDASPLSPDERRPSIMSRAAPKPRYDAHIILLVFDTAEDMQEWLLKIRTQISRLGGPSFEEHPQPSSKAGTIVEEDRSTSKTPSTFRRSIDSSRKNSTGGRKSDEIATSTSTALSHDGLVLDSLRTGSNSSRRGSQASLNTSPERPSVPDTNDRRRSNLSMAYSYSSTDLQLRSRPLSTTLGSEHTPTEPPASPTPTQLSVSSFAKRRSRGNLPPPIPIPVPSIPKRYSSAGPSGNLPSPVDIAHRRIRQNRKSSAPPSPDRVIELFSTSLPNPQSPNSAAVGMSRRPRPVSLATAPVAYHRKEYKAPNNNRRSVGSVSSAASAHGPPLHPPPSVPLPRLPDGTVGNLPKMPFPQISPYPQCVPPVPQIPIPVPHSPLALHSQSSADVPVARKHSITSLRLSRA
ncbi:hypothetical protein Dda_7868 [Drechslerella dactyloides]|uniref:PH domain-containing protein n=1 Tax=Drechslerella dactyloides TaxID=74499 RepID=A0AAD6IR33_DREDA|nr:hypothetical protein Dda_7868 [Drechslerella dactyloides]